MINFNGTVQEDESISSSNRGFKYGDAIFETLKIVNGNVLFLEDHYFRLMASMRIIRMKIPMNFTMEFLQQEVVKLVNVKGLATSVARARITVYRDSQGLYKPTDNNVSFLIETSKLEQEKYTLTDISCEVDLFKDHYITPQLLSTLKTNNRVLNVIASVYAKENELDNCLLLNSNKHVVEAINGNLFLVKGNIIKTVPLTDGCIKGVLRKQLVKMIGKMDGYILYESSISPFELQQADELFYTNVIQGIVSITKYRKKEFTNVVTKTVLEQLNATLV